MVESLGVLDYELAIELFLASALFWVLVVLVIRIFSIKDAVWRIRFFLLPIMVPLVVIPSVHLIVHFHLLWFIHPFIERFLTSSVHLAPLVYVIFFGLAGVAMIIGVTCSVLPLVIALRYQWIARHRYQESFQLTRCNRIAASLASRLRIPAPKIILTPKDTCSSFYLNKFWSYVIVSKNLVPALDDEELEGLLAHELGHIKRHDTLLGAIVSVCYHLLSFSPFCHLAYRDFIRAREEAADDLAVRVSGLPLALASCLVKAYGLSKGYLQLLPVNVSLLSSGTVYERITRLLNTTPTGTIGSRKGLILIFSAVIVLGSSLLLYFT